MPNAHAYLDPGTGSLLLSSCVAIIASAVFFIKGRFYKILDLFKTNNTNGASNNTNGGGGGNSLWNVDSKTASNSHNSANHKNPLHKFKRNKNYHGIVFYNEGKQYFSVFHPIVEYFESINYPYTYYTSAPNDPLLSRKTSNIIEFIGDTNKSYLKLNNLSADIVLMTTPQLDVLQIKRSKGVTHYCHIIHSLPHVDNYEIFALDYFDSVFTNSPIHTDFIRQVEAKRTLKTKLIEITGCTYLDALESKLHNLMGGKRRSDFMGGVSGAGLETARVGCGILAESGGVSGAGLETKTGGLRGLGRNEINENESETAFLESNKTHKTTESKNEDSKNLDSREFKNADFQFKDSKNLDSQNSQCDSLSPNPHLNFGFKNPNRKTILISPSWGREALLSKYGMKIIAPLLDSSFNIIIRPHPQSHIAESAMLESIKKHTAGRENIAWDSNVDNIFAMSAADIMLGDFSGILFDFLCLFSKPIAVMKFDFNITGYDLEDIYDTPWVASALKKIGTNIDPAELSRLPEILESAINNKELSQNVAQMRELLWHHRGRSAEVTAKALLRIHKEILDTRLDSILGDKRGVYENLVAVSETLAGLDSKESGGARGLRQTAWAGCGILAESGGVSGRGRENENTESNCSGGARGLGRDNHLDRVKGCGLENKNKTKESSFLESLESSQTSENKESKNINSKNLDSREFKNADFQFKDSTNLDSQNANNLRPKPLDPTRKVGTPQPTQVVKGGM